MCMGVWTRSSQSRVSKVTPDWEPSWLCGRGRAGQGARACIVGLEYVIEAHEHVELD